MQGKSKTAPKVRVAYVKIERTRVLKVMRDYAETKRMMEDTIGIKGLYEIYHARFLAYNNLIFDLGLPIEL